MQINNLYGYIEDYSYLEEILNKALETLDINDAIFSIIFISDEEMHKLNKEYRGINKTTDVLSFAFEDNNTFESEVRVLGDIYISIPKMKAQALEYGHHEKRELTFLAVHGLLHLLGYDHQTKDDEKIMFDLQEVILSEN